VVITEIMQNPDAVPDSDGEWFEIMNVTSRPLEIAGCEISDLQATHAIPVAPSFPIAPGAALVLARSAAPGFTPDYVYDVLALSNGTDGVTLSCAGTVIDVVSYDDGATFPDPIGASMQLDPSTLDAASNDLGSNWCASTISFVSGDLGTPGETNLQCF
jgi:hypothetical protein